ncbi:hypothetical protein HAP48_0042510 [Bradyrhizobium septentrionale]|uniref:Uncharacterized protein n=1 Tax=Bradyrhizobium septentrionale TaxID=1404411 RepID=A0A973W2K4_9BRAD|nr:hypothetical protein [Bradyrhizobium septentrionale]UGY15132.1 hypothetical protein HAP48_0042510 [Bradyrhizobium septentrionale]UGY23737.1 hypothetical protein HU675_0038290 [Bradyrhizobium septentrionale]
MARPAGSYRGARRNEAKESGQQMLTLAELRRINEMAHRNAAAAQLARPDKYVSVGELEPLGDKFNG